MESKLNTNPYIPALKIANSIGIENSLLVSWLIELLNPKELERVFLEVERLTQGQSLHLIAQSFFDVLHGEQLKAA